MNMHILSDQQFQQITTALEQAFVAINACQHIELDLTKPKQTIPLPVGERLVRATDVQKPESQSKTRGSSRKKRAALTEKKVLEIKRQLQAGGKSVAKIAKEFGVHSTTINCIKWNKTWKHVTLQQDQPTTVVI
jgi:transcriptional regulator with PAS, ATPase and Fis domain